MKGGTEGWSRVVIPLEIWVKYLMLRNSRRAEDLRTLVTLLTPYFEEIRGQDTLGGLSLESDGLISKNDGKFKCVMVNACWNDGLLNHVKKEKNRLNALNRIFLFGIR